MPQDEPERTRHLAGFGRRALRMWALWRDLERVERQSTCPWVGGEARERIEFCPDKLRLALEYGHPALTLEDEPADVLAAMLLICRVINSNPDFWPETSGLTEEEWERMQAQGRGVRAPTPGVGDA